MTEESIIHETSNNEAEANPESTLHISVSGKSYGSVSIRFNDKGNEKANEAMSDALAAFVRTMTRQEQDEL